MAAAGGEAHAGQWGQGQRLGSESGAVLLECEPFGWAAAEERESKMGIEYERNSGNR